jgi:hypothetical protein
LEANINELRVDYERKNSRLSSRLAGILLALLGSLSLLLLGSLGTNNVVNWGARAKGGGFSVESNYFGRHFRLN